MLDNNERMNTIICLIIVIIFLIFITLYLFTKKDISKQKETFTTSPIGEPNPSTPTATTILDNIIKLLNNDPSLWTKDHVYIEPLNDIPYYKNLVLYGTTFSDKTHYDKEIDVYIPTMSRWNNFLKDDQHFFINSTSLPPKIKSPEGLALKDTSLSINNDDNIFGKNFELTQFTVTMVLKVNTIDFGTSTEIELLSIALETPNVIRLILEPDLENDANVFLYSHIGDDTPECKSGITIPKTSFNDETSLSLVYLKDDSGKSKRFLFKNGTEVFTSEQYQLNYPLQLGITGSIINKGKNLDATLNMFMYHDMAFKDVENHKKIYDYYTKQKSELPTITSFINNVTKEQLLSIKSIIDDSTITQTKMKEELDKCITNKTPPQEEDFKYKISSIGNVQISDEDIGSCPLLNIDKRIGSLSSSSPSQLEKSKKTTESKFPYYIKLPF